MKKIKLPVITLPLIITIMLSLLVWYLLNSILLALAYGILIILGIFYVLKQKKKNDKLYKDIDSAYNFVNLMNVSMLSSTSIYEAYKSIENYVSIDFSNISSDDIQGQLVEIANDYNLNSFKMYVNTLIMFDNEGGDFKEESKIPSSLCQKCKVYYNKLLTNKLLKLVEITVLYFMWLLVMVFMKASITNYYDLMMEEMIYQIAMLFILMSGSFIYLLSVNEYYKNEIKGM